MFLNSNYRHGNSLKIRNFSANSGEFDVFSLVCFGTVSSVKDLEFDILDIVSRYD